MSGKKIMVVDDNVDVVRVLSDKLRVHGFQVFEATSGLEAMKKVTSEKPDLILLDIMMPGIDGTELFQRLRDSQAGSKIPVIFITALMKPEDVNKPGALVGDHPVFPKPYDFPRLLATINTMIFDAS